MKVLLVPSIRASMGSGHLRRILRLAEIFGPQSAVLLEDLDRALGSRGLIPGRNPHAPGPGSSSATNGGKPQTPGRNPDASTPGSASGAHGGGRMPRLRALLEPLGIDQPAHRFLERYDPQERWDLVIVDRRSSGVEQISRFFPAPVVGVDEGGPARRYCSYLVDTFPVVRQGHPANLAALSLLDLPEGRSRDNRSRLHHPFDRVLISFGGEDPADLSSRLLKLLLGKRLLEANRITVVQGPYFERERWPEAITVLRNPTDLKSLLGGYDLLFCSFGLTSYEALAAGVPVINLNPCTYHRRLSKAAGIPEIGVRRPSERKLRRLLERPAPLAELLSRYPPEIFTGPPRLSDLPVVLQPSGKARCPVCGTAANPAAARFVERSYFRCRKCGILYLIAFGARGGGIRGSRGGPHGGVRYNGVRYNKEYFFSEYRKQYGRTYLEDFPFIKAKAGARLRHIRAAARPHAAAYDHLYTGVCAAVPADSGPRLLDVGCAYGPFLQAALEQGYRVQGLDISGEAVRYVREQLGIPCVLGDFSADGAEREIVEAGSGFDVITLWYVIEHFRDAAAVLKRINRLLKPGGVFAFSTPNGSGISARKSRVRFLENSPEDHYTLWPLRSTAGILRRFGFRLRKIVVTGHHGERFPWPARLEPDSAVASGFSVLSRLLRLGDTFEAYVVKVRDLQ